MADVPMIGDMSITDEHKLMPIKTKMKKVLDILRTEPSTAVILHDKNKKIIGVVTAEDIDTAVDAGKNPKKLSVEDVMLTNILEVPSDVPITRAIEVIAQKGPDAVIVRHRDGEFAGYFSVEDYHEAKDLVDSQKARAQQFQENTQDFGSRATALQNQLEEENETIDDGDEHVPAGMKGLPLSPQMKSAFRSAARNKPDSSRSPAEVVNLDDDPNRIQVEPPSGPSRDSGGPPSRGPPGRNPGPPSRGPPGRPPSAPEPEPEPVHARPAGPALPGGGPPPRSGGGGVTSVIDTTAQDNADVGGHMQVEGTGAASGPSIPGGPAQRTGPSDPIEADFGARAPTAPAEQINQCSMCGNRLAPGATCTMCNPQHQTAPVRTSPGPNMGADPGMGSRPGMGAGAGPGSFQASQPMGGGADEVACPYCGETIKAVAKKCRFCMEWLN